jgi:hypothetical protein
MRDTAPMDELVDERLAHRGRTAAGGMLEYVLWN